MTVSASQDDMREVVVTARIVVTRAELDRYGDSNVTDVLARQSGVTVETLKGRGPEIKLRGLGSGYTVLLLDGAAAPPGFSIETLSPSQIERIEIQRGSSAEQSSQGIAGSINFVLRKSVQRTGAVKMAATSTTAGMFPRFEATTVTKTDSTRVSFGAVVTRDGNRNVYVTDERYTMPSAAGYVRQFTETDSYRRTGLDFSMTSETKLSAEQTLKMDALLRGRRSWETYDEVALPVRGGLPAYAQSYLVIEPSVVSGSINTAWNRRFAGGATLESSLAYSNAHTPSESALVSRDFTDAVAFERFVTSLPVDQQATLSFRVRLSLSDLHIVRFGVSETVKDRTEARTQREQSIAQSAIVQDERFYARTVNPAVFVQDEINVGEAFTANVGLRWEGLQTRIKASGVDDVRHSFGLLSPSMNVVWKPSKEREQYRLGFSRTYRPPTPSELTPRRFVDTTNSPVSPDTIGNPFLLPESAWGLDVAYERYWEQGDMVSIGAYVKQIQNVIARRLVNNTDRWTMILHNLGRAAVHGVEFELRRHLGHLDPALKPYEIKASAGWHFSRVQSISAPDNRLDQQDSFIGTLAGEYRSAVHPLTLSINASANAGAWINRGSGLREHLPSRSTLSVAGTWRYPSGALLRASVLNPLRPSIDAEKMFAADGAVLDRTVREMTSRTYRIALELPI